ncbi:MAG: HlyD family efflux transporter periplasmic adaptor subunit [Bacteroidota bacterium]
MNKSTRRLIISIVASILVIFGAFGVANYFNSLKQPPPRRNVDESLKVVEIATAQYADIPSQVDIEGELVAFDKIDIFAEVSGTLINTSKPFKVGSYFPKGSVLIKVDQEEAQLSLLSQKSNLLNGITQMMPDLKIDYPESFKNWNEYLENFVLEDPIKAFPEPVNKQEKYFVASKNLLTQYYTIKSAEERLEKYTLSAPFGGVITEALINPGAVVRAGQKLGSLMNTYQFELEVTVPLSELKYIVIGTKVELISDELEGSWNGSVSRIDNQVDPGTQTVKVFIKVSGNGLREGMYMHGDFNGKNINNAIAIPRELLINQESVYILQDTVLKLHDVEVVKLTEENAIIKGVPEGTQMLNKMLPGLFDGIRVEAKL